MNEHEEPRWPYAGRGHRDARQGAWGMYLERVVSRYPGAAHVTLNEVSLTVANGECWALVGANGAGKSTLLKTIAGLLPFQSGTILIAGNPIGACHHRVAYVPQHSDVDWSFPLTIEELVLTGRYVHLGWLRWPLSRDRAIVRRQLERLGIAGIARHRIGDVSGGQQRRALLARALAQGASLFLLDEPLNGVDEATRRVFVEVLRGEAGRGGCVLAATHDLGSLEESFDRVATLNAGRLSVGSPAQCVASLVSSGSTWRAKEG